MSEEEKSGRLKIFGEFIRNSAVAMLRGEFLLRLRFDRYFLYICWFFVLAVGAIWIKLEIDKTMTRLEETRTELENYKIYHAQKTCELVSLDRVSTVQDMLEKAGSDLTIPKKPADKLK